MKIIFVNKIGKQLIIRDKLQALGFENIEVVPEIGKKINKTDIVITTCFNKHYEEYQKVNHLIILTQETNPKEIYQMVSKLNVIDVISINENIDYIVHRMERVIRKCKKVS